MKPEDLTAEKKEIKLADEQLEAVSGGTGGSSRIGPRFVCRKCGSTDVQYEDCGGCADCRCQNCGYHWFGG